MLRRNITNTIISLTVLLGMCELMTNSVKHLFVRICFQMLWVECNNLALFSILTRSICWHFGVNNKIWGIGSGFWVGIFGIFYPLSFCKGMIQRLNCCLTQRLPLGNI